MSEQEAVVRPSVRLWLMLFCGTMLYFFVLFLRSAVPGPIFGLLQKELNEPSAVASLGSMFMLPYAGTQLVAGVLVDRFGGRKVIFWGGLLLCAGALMFPLSRSLGMYYTARVMAGVGAGTIYLCLVKDAMLFPKQWYGMLIGTIVTIGFLGGVVSNSPFVYLVRQTGDFHTVLLWTAIVLVVFYLVWMVTAAGAPGGQAAGGTFSLKPFGEVVRKGANWTVFLFNSLNFALFYVLQTVIGKTFLEGYLEISEEKAALVFSGTATVTALSGLLFPLLSRLLGDRRGLVCKLVGGVTVLAFGLLLVMLLTGARLSWLAVALFLVLAFTMNSMVIVVPLLRSLNTDATTGSAVSVLNFLNFFFVAAFGKLAGVLLGAFGGAAQGGTQAFVVFFAVMMAFSVVELGCALCLKD